MRRHAARWLSLVLPALCVVAVASPAGHPVTATRDPRGGHRDGVVDRLFDRWRTPGTPGCAVGVARGGRTVLLRGYGMASLEHDVPITPETIFEAGSISKQFTATAVWLLARDGRLSLDDPVRRWVPELPDYGDPLTIRQMLTHTSGLRDWGDIAAIAGWPRTTRVHTHAHVLDIVARQRFLNFRPGTQYSYSNSGYNLAAILVARVSGRSFAEFTRERIFRPLGMLHTSWRDDHTRIVRNRATAYATTDDGYRMLMPFEDVHGNGGLLTRVADLLVWNRNFVDGRVGGAALAADLQRPATLSDGREIAYGLGLRLARYRGEREVSHAGVTAAYHAYLARYPEEDLSVALLCNAGDVDAERLAHRVADPFLTRAAGPPTPATPVVMARDRPGTGPSAPIGPGTAGPVSEAPCAPPCLAVRPEVTGRAAQAVAAAGVYASVVGRYRSDEAEVELLLEEKEGRLQVRRRPADGVAVRWLRPDTFTSPLGLARLVRDERGHVTALSLATARVHDLRFVRLD